MTQKNNNNMRIHTVVSPHPILPQKGRQELELTVKEKTVLGLVNSLPASLNLHRLDIHVFVNDRLVPRAEWSTHTLNEGDTVCVKQAVHGGNNGKSNPLQIILMIVIIVIAVYTGQYYLANYAGATEMGAYAISSAIMMAGSLVLSALFPVQLPKPQNTVENYNITSIRNSIRPYEPLPLVVGTVRFFPDLGSKPFVDQDRNDSYLSSIFNYGFGELEIANTKIGDTEITEYQEVAYQWANSTNSVISLVPGNLDSVEGGELKKEYGWITRTTPANTTCIALDVSGALYKTDSDGDLQVLSVQIEVQISPAGQNNWVPFTGTNTSNNTIWQTSQQQILGRLIRTMVVGSNYSANGLMTLASGQTKPYRWTATQFVDDGQYDVRMRRNTEDFTKQNKVAQLQWGQMRCYQTDPATYEYQTRLGVRIRATGQLNGAIETLNSIVSSKIPVWNGSAWNVETSSNPAWIYLYIARGQRDSVGRRLWGGGIADSRIDVEGLKTWGAWCDAHGLECNYAFQSKVSIADMLSLVARCGRGTMTWQKGVLGVVYDAEDLPITQVFGPGNIVAGSFAVNYITKNLADEIIIKFRNKDLEYQEDEVRVTVANTASPANPVELTVEGVTSVAQATKEANLTAARQFYHRRRVSFETDVEGLMVSRGDVIALSHDLTSWGAGGRLVGANTGSTTQLFLDRDITFTSSNTAYMGIRAPDGTYEIKQVNNPYVSSNVTVSNVTLSSALSFNPYSDPDNHPRDYLFIFDFSATPGRKLKVISVEPTQENRVRLSCVDEVPEYYAAEDNATTYVPPTLLNTSNIAISNIEVTEEFQGYNQPLKIWISWDGTQLVGARVQMSVNDSPYIDFGFIEGNAYDIDLTSWKVDDKLVFLLTPVGVDSRKSVTLSSYTYYIKGLPTITEGINLPRISGLELFGQGNDTEWLGKNPVFVWRKAASNPQEIGSEELGADSPPDPYFQDYQVEIYDWAGNLRRTEWVTSETYSYTWEMNTEDGAGTPSRYIEVRVYYRSKTNQIGLPAVLRVSNSAPEAPTGVRVSSILKNLYVQADRPSDMDFQGMEVHVSQNSGYTPNANTLVYTGPDTAVTLSVSDQDYGNTLYVRLGFYDGFDSTPSAYSTANSVTLAALSDQDAQIELNERPGLIDIADWVDPPTDPMGGWDLFAGSIANTSMEMANTGPFGVMSPQMILHGSNPPAGTNWFSSWRHYFDVNVDRSYVLMTWVKKLSSDTNRGLYIGWTNAAGYINTMADVESTNPYGISNAGATMTVDKWYLAVQVLQAANGTTTTGLSGLYDPDDGSILVAGTDFKHQPGVTQQYFRIGFYSNTTVFDEADGFAIAAPQLHVMDGAEPSIDSLLRRSYQQGALAKLDQIDYAQFATGIEPVEVIAAKPGSFSNSNTIFVTGEGKLYRWNGSAYTASVANTDMTGTIITTQIADDAISTPKLQANAVTAGIISSNAIESRHITADSITAGMIQAGAIGADEIAANEITARHLKITNLGMALNKNPTTDDLQAWFANADQSANVDAYAEWSVAANTTANTGTTTLQYSGTTSRQLFTEKMPLDQNKVYRISLNARQEGSGTNYLTVVFYDSSNTAISGGTSGWSTGTYHYWGRVNQAFPTTWTPYTVTFGKSQSYTVPSNAKWFAIGCLTNYSGTAGTTINFNNYRVEEVLGGELIVDGGITAAKINVSYLSAINANVGAITAGTIALDTTGWIRSGATGYGSGTGIWLGKDASTSKLYIGSSTKHIKWDGSNMNIAGTIQSTNYSANTAGWRILDSGTAEFNNVTVRGDGYFTDGNTSNTRIEIVPSNTFIMWAGTNTKDANTANAIMYVRANGQAYFGGSILESYRPRAWARFYGTTSAYFTRQYNMSAITKGGTGIYIFTFETPLPNKFYTVLATAVKWGSQLTPLIPGPYNFTTNSFYIRFKDAGGTARDTELGSVVVFGSDEVWTDPPPSYDWETDPYYPNYPYDIP